MLLTLVNALARKKFLIIGRAGMDFYPDPPGEKTEEAQRFVCALGGSAANIGVALRKLGCDASLVTCVSNDAIGRYALNQLRNYGLDTQYVRSIDGEKRTSLEVVESRMEDPQSVIYRNGAADFEMTPDDVSTIDYIGYGALVVTGMVFASQPSCEAGFAAIDRARIAGLPVIADLDYRPSSWESSQAAAMTYSRLVRLCDIVVGNREEFAVLAGFGDRLNTPEATNEGQRVAQNLVKTDTAMSVYTMGEAGSIIYQGLNTVKCGIYKTSALKPTGAGDAFIGGLLARLADNSTLEDAARFASACAALVISRVACAPAMPGEGEVAAGMDALSYIDP